MSGAEILHKLHLVITANLIFVKSAPFFFLRPGFRISRTGHRCMEATGRGSAQRMMKSSSHDKGLSATRTRVFTGHLAGQEKGPSGCHPSRARPCGEQGLTETQRVLLPSKHAQACSPRCVFSEGGVLLLPNLKLGLGLRRGRIKSTQLRLDLGNSGACANTV